MADRDDALDRLGRAFEPCEYELKLRFDNPGWTMHLSRRETFNSSRSEVLAQASLPFGDLAIETACRMLTTHVREKP